MGRKIGDIGNAMETRQVFVNRRAADSGRHAPRAPYSALLHVVPGGIASDRGGFRSRDFYGERSGRVRDPFGYDWLIGHTIETIDPNEMQRRYTALMSGNQ